MWPNGKNHQETSTLAGSHESHQSWIQKNLSLQGSNKETQHLPLKNHEIRVLFFFFFHLPILHSERDVSIRLQSAVQELWSPSGNTSLLFSRKAPMLNDKDQDDNVYNYKKCLFLNWDKDKNAPNMMIWDV